MGNKIQSINWEEIEMETVNDSMCRRIVTGEKMTVAKIYFDDGFVAVSYTHLPLPKKA